MEVQNILHMIGGEGDTSYANNSTIQRTAINKVRPIVEEAILDLYCISFPKKLIMADLGCSSGPNAPLVLSNIIDAISMKCRELNHPLPEFQMFLNDLPGNDFNTIFRSLPGFYEKLKEEKGVDFGLCFVAGVAGSFYGRLFPTRSLHFVHSSYSLHWLSQVPQRLQITLNGGSIYLAKTSPLSVFKAYLAQFQNDFSLFLKLRSEEIVGGGRMVLTLIGKISSDPSNIECCWEPLAQALNDMVIQGVIEQERVDSFNLPYYAPSIHELKDIIETDGSFSLDRLEIIEPGYFKSAQEAAKIVRAITESMLAGHFGEAILDDLFQRYEVVVAEYLSNEKANPIRLVLSMTRKG
ncbi:putative jasmonic acid carboxyl methyltransferase 1 isoform X2 [Tasmannia lanceolata]|uniref:putative jasmonic acid carboxyl methyltransferase 1 isoform X2 n=1 Tax=Tasmannia lanceolata TaxID=3420 RepID=UPI0040638CA8